MIQFGFSSSATGISVENVTLDGQGQPINGVVNPYSSYLTYVDRVTLFQILGTGLAISGTADNSGPYSNITFDLNGNSGTSQTVCVSITGLSSTHGVRGLTCIANSPDPPAAVLLDSSNNSIEDARIVGFYDGIRVGANNNAQSNVLMNIYGDTENPCPPPCNGSGSPVNVVHIFKVGNTVTDLSIMGLRNSGGAATTTVQDDITDATLPDTSVGIYALGKESSGGYSRFTTSPNATVATWVVGQMGPQNSCSAGSLYSCIGGTANGCSYTLYGCVNAVWHGIQ
jgi:hypothetical protein